MNNVLVKTLDLFYKINSYKPLFSSSGIQQIQQYFFSFQFHTYYLFCAIEKIEDAVLIDELVAEITQAFFIHVHEMSNAMCNTENIMSLMLDRRRNFLISDQFFPSNALTIEKGSRLDVLATLQNMIHIVEKSHNYCGMELLSNCAIARIKKDLGELKLLTDLFIMYLDSIDPSSILTKEKADLLLINFEGFFDRYAIYFGSLSQAMNVMEDNYFVYKELQKPKPGTRTSVYVTKVRKLNY